MRWTITDNSNIIETEIQRLSGLKFRSLRLPPDLERAFEEQTRAGRCKRLWLEGLLALLIFNMLLLAGQLSHPAPPVLSLIHKLYLFSPPAILINLSMLLKPSARIREASIGLLAVALGLALLFFQFNQGVASALLAQVGLVVVLIFSHSVMRLRFAYAVAVSAVLAFGEALFINFDRTQPANVRCLGLGITIAALIFTAIGNYSHNRQERLGFLLCLRGDLLIKELHQKNDALAVAAEQDALTGLANRRSFDRRLQEYWKECSEKGLVLGVILIDIDHFKGLNDTFGHLFGDKVLRRVGHLLDESLRKKGDFAARFGGEEFAILLPGTELANALIVAERLRSLVQVAGLPPLEDAATFGDVRSATVSCGVAAGSPLQFESTQAFLTAADQALYRAKASGRNCICTITEVESLPESVHQKVE